MEKKRTVFLTGATGLVGSYLLKVLLENGHKVYALARGKNNKTPQERVEGILKFWDEDIIKKKLKNLVVVEGDITKEDLGLEGQDNIRNEIEGIFHCAAVTEINWQLDAIRKVNVEGTKEVLEFALECKNLKSVNYISTAYVCGDYNREFSEGDLDVQQKFNNSYEQSKFEAEKVIENYRQRGLWVDIFRPSFIVGEAATGKTFQFQHLYRFLHIFFSGIFDNLPVLGLNVNLIPVDSVARALSAIFFSTKNKNKTYHLISSQTTSLKRISNLAMRMSRVRFPKLIDAKHFSVESFTPIQKQLLEKNIFVINSQVKFISRETHSYLAKNNFKIPKINDSLLRKLIKYSLYNGRFSIKNFNI